MIRTEYGASMLNFKSRVMNKSSCIIHTRYYSHRCAASHLISHAYEHACCSRTGRQVASQVAPRLRFVKGIAAACVFLVTPSHEACMNGPIASVVVPPLTSWCSRGSMMLPITSTPSQALAFGEKRERPDLKPGVRKHARKATETFAVLD